MESYFIQDFKKNLPCRFIRDPICCCKRGDKTIVIDPKPSNVLDYKLGPKVVTCSRVLRQPFSTPPLNYGCNQEPELPGVFISAIRI